MWFLLAKQQETALEEVGLSLLTEAQDKLAQSIESQTQALLAIEKVIVNDNRIYPLIESNQREYWNRRSYQ